jgi:hypothetical protein
MALVNSHECQKQVSVTDRVCPHCHIAQALRADNLAGFMPTLAGGKITKKSLKMVNLPFLKPLSIKIALVWDARLKPFRPCIAKISTDLISVLRFDAKAVIIKV